MKTGLHINLEGRDMMYEAVFNQIYGTKINARRNHGHRSHYSNLVYTYYNAEPEGLPSYQDQLNAIKKALFNAIENIYQPQRAGHEKDIQTTLLKLKFSETHTEISIIILDLWTILNS